MNDTWGALPALPRLRRRRTWPGSLAIFVFVFAFVGFWITWDSRVPSTREIPAGTTLQVAPDVSYVPAQGWALDTSATAPGSTSMITRGALAFQVKRGQWQSDLPAKVEQERKLLAAGGLGLSGEGTPFHTAGGLRGVKLYYTGKQAEGVIWLATRPGTRTLVTVNAQSALGALQPALPQIQRMVDSLTIGAAS